MVFASEVFIFTFLPLFLLVYYAAPVRFRSHVILVGSYVFYGWWRIDFLFLMMASTLWVYGFGHLIHRAGDDRAAAKRMMAVGIAGCLATLGFFKYFGFFTSSLEGLTGSAPGSLTIVHVILPIGISFYLFHSISYLVDVYRGDAPPARSLVDFAAFISLFPHLVAGPILRYKDLSDQFANRTYTVDKFAEGVRRFGIGLAKKVLIADTVAPLADAMFAIHDPTMAESWAGAIAYAVQLYFDFSGYSDMAVGLALMLGFRFVENFHFPYTSRSITDFWRRWHISLSLWLRDYLYIPLGGNRKGSARTYVNLFLTMLLGGLWHGANWTFVIWGAWHGGWLAVERRLGLDRTRVGFGHAAAVLSTFVLVVLGWVMFRSPDVATAFRVYEGMVGMNGLSIRPDVAWQISREALAFTVFGLALAFAEPAVSRFGNRLASGAGAAAVSASTAGALAVGILCLVSVLRISEQATAPFLYFQF